MLAESYERCDQQQSNSSDVWPESRAPDGKGQCPVTVLRIF